MGATDLVFSVTYGQVVAISLTLSTYRVFPVVSFSHLNDVSGLFPLITTTFQSLGVAWEYAEEKKNVNILDIPFF